MKQSLTEEEIQKGLADLPDWKIVTSLPHGGQAKTRTELVRQFRFPSFEQAIAFMQAAVPHINQINHHPRWENVHKTVAVYLSTWDRDHMISDLDLDLARYLDELFESLKHSK